MAAEVGGPTVAAAAEEEVVVAGLAAEVAATGEGINAFIPEKNPRINKQHTQ